MKKIVISILILESRLILRKYKPFVVAVTGSVGKTSTKDAIYDVLKEHAGFVRKSEKSFNSEIGLPLTVLGVPNGWHDMAVWIKNIWIGLLLILVRRPYPECLILEIGADHPGDIRRVTKWLRPDISVITRISKTPVHVEFFKSPEQVFEEKAFLATGVKNGGTLVVFGDDERTLSLGDRVKDRNVSVVSYGVHEGNSVRATDVRVEYENGAPVGMTMNISAQGKTGPISVRGVLGDGIVYSILAAYAVASARGCAIYGTSPAFDVPRGRMILIPGMNGSTLIDDSYNSSPDAASAALSILGRLETSGAKIAVLGDMMELGKFAADEHRKIGAEAARTVNMLVTVGQRSRFTAEEALKSGMTAEQVKTFDTSREAAAYLATVVKTGDAVLIKGSQSVRMERVSRALLRDAESAPKVLVRQEKEWLQKA